jgi:ribonuclease R
VKGEKGGNGKPGGKRRQAGKKVNFEPDSAFRGEKKQKPKAAKKEARSAKNLPRKRRKSLPPPKRSARRRKSRRSKFSLTLTLSPGERENTYNENHQ